LRTAGIKNFWSRGREPNSRPGDFSANTLLALVTFRQKKATAESPATFSECYIMAESYSRASYVTTATTAFL